MNWQAVVDSLRQDVDSLYHDGRKLRGASQEKVLGMAAGLKLIADALQMGVNKRNEVK